MVVKLEYDANASARRKVIITTCDWKEALPHPSEQKIICVAIGNSNYNWAILQGQKDGFVPTTFWKSPCIRDTDMKGNNPSELLRDYIPSHVHEEVFGGFDMSGNALGNQLAAALRIPSRSVYVLSTNTKHERGLMYAFSDMNARFFRLENRDFFSAEDGCYDTFGVDRAACLFAGFENDVLPLLVIDGGTAMTYTGLDAKGKIMGGGISPGLGAQFRSLSEYCGNLPLISFEEYNVAGSLPVFATDTKQAMMTSVLQQVRGNCHFVIKQFINALRNQKDNGENENDPKEPNVVSEKKPTVFMTGGDSGFLVNSLHNSEDLLSGNINVNESKHLAVYGIGCLIKAKSSESSTPTPAEELRLRLLGQRVAKTFPEPDLDGDYVYRGSIVSVSPGDTGRLKDDLYSVRYDDGDSEEMALMEVYDSLQLYVRVGEKETADQTIWTMKRRDDSKQRSEDSSKHLLKDFPTLKETLEKKAKMEKDKAAAAKAAADAAANAVVVANGAGASAVSTTAVTEAVLVENNSLISVKRPLSGDSSENIIVELKKAKLAPESYVGLQVAKYFSIENQKGKLEEVLYIGKVESYDKDDKFWHIRYEDDDEEDFDETDLKIAIQLHIKLRGPNGNNLK